MKFKIDKHNLDRLWCLVCDIYTGLLNHPHFKDRGKWEIVYEDIVGIGPIKYPERVKLHKKSIEICDEKINMDIYNRYSKKLINISFKVNADYTYDKETLDRVLDVESSIIERFYGV